MLKKIVSLLIIAAAMFWISLEVSDFVKDIKAEKEETDTGDTDPVSYPEIKYGNFVFEETEDGALSLKKYTGSEKIVTVPSEVGGKSVTKIGKLAFNAAALTEQITIPETVTEIKELAFFGCSRLKMIVIPKAVESIGASAFRGCLAIESITFEGGKENSLQAIDRFAFSGCTSLKSLSIPYNVCFVGDSAFSQCTGLKTVRLGESLLTVGDGAFAYCTSLRSVEIASVECDSYGSADQPVFNGCDMLTEMIFDDGVRVIGSYLAYECTALSALTLPSGILAVGDLAFYSCTGITKVILPEKLDSIGEMAFAGCSSLADIEFKGTPKNIGDDAFVGTKWYDTREDGVIYVGNAAFGYKGSTDEKVSVTVKEGTVAISDYAFADCRNILNIILPSSLERIGRNAFSSCSGAIIFSDASVNCALKRIDEYAFAGYKGETVIIPSSVTSIGSNAFSRSRVTLQWQNDSRLERIESYSFSNYEAEELCIPSNVNYIGEYAFSETSVLVRFSEDSKLKNLSARAFANYRAYIFALPDSLESLGEECFAYSSVLAIFGPDSKLSEIGENSYKNYEGNTVFIPKSVKRIDGKAFTNCYSLVIVAYYGNDSEWAKVDVAEKTFHTMDYITIEKNLNYKEYFDMIEGKY